MATVRIVVGDLGEQVDVPGRYASEVRNLIGRIGNRFRFANKQQFLQFTDRRVVPPALAQLVEGDVPKTGDLWTFLTSPPGRVPLPPPRKMTITCW